MKVTLENLNSTAVRRVEFYYNRADQFGELVVEFANRRTYEYADFGLDDFANLMSAESLGQFMNCHVKPVFKVRELTSL